MQLLQLLLFQPNDAQITDVCTNMTILPFVEQAGHWVQQEQPDLVNNLLLQFFAR